MPQPKLRIDPEEFRSQVQSICLGKVRFELLPNAPEKSAQELEIMLESTLAASGIRAVRSVEFEGVWAEVVAEVGGLYDPHTGQADDGKHAAVRQKYRARLAEQYGCDAFLDPVVVVVTASFGSGQLAWDGATQSIHSSYVGFLPALSLHVQVEDRAGRELYFGTGGIQPLSRLDVGFWSTEFASQPQDEVLAHPDLNLHGVRASLAGMVPLVDPASETPPQPELPSQRRSR